MPLMSAGVEYGLHCLLFLALRPDGGPASARDLAELQGVPPEYVAKIFTRLQKASLVASVEGVQGGFRLARSPEAISVLQVVEAIEGGKPIFVCKNVRARCALFDDPPPDWATDGVCAIHAVMIEAEAQMRATLASHNLGALVARTAAKAPTGFDDAIGAWLQGRLAERRRPAGPDPSPSTDPGEQA